MTQDDVSSTSDTDASCSHTRADSASAVRTAPATSAEHSDSPRCSRGAAGRSASIHSAQDDQSTASGPPLPPGSSAKLKSGPQKTTMTRRSPTSGGAALAGTGSAARCAGRLHSCRMSVDSADQNRWLPAASGALAAVTRSRMSARGSEAHSALAAVTMPGAVSARSSALAVRETQPSGLRAATRQARE